MKKNRHLRKVSIYRWIFSRLAFPFPTSTQSPLMHTQLTGLNHRIIRYRMRALSRDRGSNLTKQFALINPPFCGENFLTDRILCLFLMGWILSYFTSYRRISQVSRLTSAYAFSLVSSVFWHILCRTIQHQVFLIDIPSPCSQSPFCCRDFPRRC